MSHDVKPTVIKADTFDHLEIRVGRIVTAELEPSAPKKAYRMEIDFGKFGKKTSVGRFTGHPIEDVINRLVLGVLNFGVITIGDINSEVLILGVQYPKADSGEATFISPVADSKIGGKVF